MVGVAKCQWAEGGVLLINDRSKEEVEARCVLLFVG